MLYSKLCLKRTLLQRILGYIKIVFVYRFFPPKRAPKTPVIHILRLLKPHYHSLIIGIVMPPIKNELKHCENVKFPKTFFRFQLMHTNTVLCH